MSEPEDNFIHSTEALNVLDKFQDAKMIIYVEGEDDIIFWASLFEKFGIFDFDIDFVGGIDALSEYMSKIIQDNAQIIVACDAGYSMLLANLPQHDRIITTYGYAIENTMYCPYVINYIIKKLSRDLRNHHPNIICWYDTFCSEVKPLILHDIAREKYHRPLKIYSDNCSRFLKNNSSPYLDNSKITNHIKTVAIHFKEEEIKDVNHLLEHSNRELRHLINGHFLTNGVINLVKTNVNDLSGKIPTIPLTDFFALIVDGCRICNKSCNDLSRIKKQLNALNNVKLSK